MRLDNKFRNELIEETVFHSLSTEFYSKLYSGIDTRKIKTIEDLGDLPVVTKELLSSAEAEWARRAGNAPIVQNTSGSTGEPFFIYRSAEEVQFIWQFFSEYLGTDHNQDRPLQLNFSVPQHGAPTPIPAYVHVLSSSTTDNKLIEHALMLLRKKFCIPQTADRVSIISGAHLPILLLTNYVLEHSIASTEFGVSLIGLTGRYLTKRWRKLLERVWQAKVVDRYSLSEIFGGATSCSLCQGYHFDAHVVPEIVDPVTKRLKIKGTGVLLLTSLYPFVQSQPMIRYWTGDLFDIQETECKSQSFFFKGRLSYALHDPFNSGSILLTGVDILEALDDIPSINRTEHFRDVTLLKYVQAVGMPFVRGVLPAGKDPAIVQLDVEVTFTPGLFQEHEKWLEEYVLSKLLLSSPSLAAYLDSGRIRFCLNVLPKGSLHSLEKKSQLWNK